MIFAVIDTNVLVAAVKTKKSDSSSSQILSLVFAGVIKPLVSKEILTEYRDDLHAGGRSVPLKVRHLALGALAVTGRRDAGVYDCLVVHLFFD